MAKKHNKGKNPYNDANSLFKSLTRLFSGPIVNRRRLLNVNCCQSCA